MPTMILSLAAAASRLAVPVVAAEQSNVHP
jgi:hypothetical protein